MYLPVAGQISSSLFNCVTEITYRRRETLTVIRVRSEEAETPVFYSLWSDTTQD